MLKGSKELLVWAFVLRAWRMKPGEPVTVSNVAVTRWGADRRTKYRALAKLEAAGLITILERKARTGPRVMVLL